MNKIIQINDEIYNLELKIKGQKDNGLRGTMVEKYIKCGKEGCKCALGYRHGPYQHIQYYDNQGFLRTIYVRKKEKNEYIEKIKKNNEFLKIIKKLNNLYLKKIELERKINYDKDQA